ncbi:hypothetical protein PCE1_001845 [Barthelona sp. PCE]
MSRKLNDPVSIEIEGEESYHDVASPAESYLEVTPAPAEKGIKKAYPSAAFLTIGMFAGYASLFALQRPLLMLLHNKDDYLDHNESDPLFGTCCSLLYLGNLIFRLGHNFFFAFLKPRGRVYLAFTSMLCAEIVLFSSYAIFNGISYKLVALAYGLGGMGIGSFEANLINICTPINKKTKHYAVSAIPPGIVLITVGSFLAMSLNPALDKNPQVFYLMVIFFLVIGFIVLGFIIPKVDIKSQSIKLADFWGYIKEIKQWVGPVLPYAFAMMFNMLSVSFFSPGIVLYMFDKAPVELNFGLWKMNVSYNAYIAIYNVFFFTGDFSSRRIFFNRKKFNPFWYFAITLSGALAGFSDVGSVALWTGFAVAFANGAIYVQAVSHIDDKIKKKYNLIALSFWLFIGDFGSVIGSNLIQIIKKKFFSHLEKSASTFALASLSNYVAPNTSFGEYLAPQSVAHAWYY